MFPGRPVGGRGVRRAFASRSLYSSTMRDANAALVTGGCFLEFPPLPRPPHGFWTFHHQIGQPKILGGGFASELEDSRHRATPDAEFLQPGPWPDIMDSSKPLTPGEFVNPPQFCECIPYNRWTASMKLPLCQTSSRRAADRCD